MSAADADAVCHDKLEAARASGTDKPVACLSWNTAASGAGLRANLSAWPTPNWCDDHGANAQWYVTRFKACGIFPADLTVHDSRTGEVVGRMHYLTVAYAYSAREWTSSASTTGGSRPGLPAGGVRSPSLLAGPRTGQCSMLVTGSVNSRSGAGCCGRSK